MKSLPELDSNYKEKMNKLSNEERLAYCIELIERFQNIMDKNRSFLSEKIKKEFSDLIYSAQAEIKMIEKEKRE